MHRLIIIVFFQQTGQKRILIAPFLANVDITESGQIFYRQSTEQDLLDRCDDSIRQYFVKFANFKTKFIIIATWVGVSFFGYSGGAAPVRSKCFYPRSANFIIFRLI